MYYNIDIDIEYYKQHFWLLIPKDQVITLITFSLT